MAGWCDWGRWGDSANGAIPLGWIETDELDAGRAEDMLKIRLARHGRKGRPFYRVVVQDSRKPRDGRFVESLGHYDPLTEPATFSVDSERVTHWLSHGAQPTETVHRIPGQRGPDRTVAAEAPQQARGRQEGRRGGGRRLRIASSAMEDFIEYVAKWMVDEPDAVKVERVQNGDHVAIQLNVHEDDMGRIIGREGRLAMAMRTLLSVSGHARAVDTSLDIR